MFKFRRSSSLCSPTKEIFQDDPKEQAEMSRTATEQPSEKPDPKEMTKWSFNGDKLKANFRKSFIGQVICDRKRKERQESISQDDYGQEKKVVRSVSDDEGVHDPEKKFVKDIRRSVSHDDFGRKPEMKIEKHTMPPNKERNEGTKEQVTTPPATVLVDRPEANMMRKVDYSTGDYEPEAQRQLERFVNYSSGTSTPTKSSKGHRRRHKSSHRHHSHASESSTASIELELEDDATVPQDEVETHEDVDSPVVSDESSSSEEDSSRSVPLVLVEDSSSVENKDGSDGLRLDFSTMHHQIETSQPISFLESIGHSSDDHVMLSPRGGFHMKDAMDLPPSPPMYQIQVDPPLSRQSLMGENESNLNKLNSLTRQVSNLKKTLRSLEEEYEQLFGYKPSKADKMKHKDMRKVVLQLVKTRKELKDLKEDPASIQEANLLSSKGAPVARSSSDYLNSLSSTVKELQDSLSSNRRVVGRSDNPEKMSSTELSEEKNMMQKQLLTLERRHGRPISKAEKDVVRPLYDHYRIVKKLSGRAAVSAMKEPTVGLDLVPILENEPLDTTCSVVEVRKGGSPKSTKGSRSCSSELTNSAADVSDERREGQQDEGWEESFNKMNLEELEKALKQVREDKRKFRSILRRFEMEFQEAKGRPPLKEEKYAAGDIEGVYGRYKHARSIVRLLEVLVNKKKYPHLLQEQYQSED